MTDTGRTLFVLRSRSDQKKISKALFPHLDEDGVKTKMGSSAENKEATLILWMMAIF